MKDILFTTADFIRSVTIVSDNLQDKYILSSIREAQDIEFQQVVGTRLYNRLKMMVEDESILFDFNVHYRELLDKAQYFIAYQTLANLTVNSTYKINNVGLNTISDDNVSTPSLTDTFKLAKYYTDKADHYKMMLQNWLLKNKSYFPELLKSDISELSANVHSAASCNVFLGGARGKVSRVPSTLKDESQEANKPFTTGELSVTANGVYLPKDQDLDAFSKVTVEVQIPKIKVQGDFGGFLKKLIPDENKYLDLRMFDVSKVNSLNDAFAYTENRYNYIDTRGWDTSNVTSLVGTFSVCYGISELDLSHWNVDRVTSTGRMFYYALNLASINLSNWNLSRAEQVSEMFSACGSLTTLNMDNAILPKIDLNIALNNSNNLTVESLVSVLNALQQLDNGESHYIQLGSENITKLSDDQKAIAINKGWTLS